MIPILALFADNGENVGDVLHRALKDASNPCLKIIQKIRMLNQKECCY